LLRGDRAGGVTVDRDLESRRRSFESMGVRVASELAAQNDARRALERRKVNGGGFANPGGIVGELIEINPAVGGEAPGEGAAGGWRVQGTHVVKREGRRAGA